MKYLLDSNTVAAAIGGRLPVVLKLAQIRPADVAVSAISRFEAEAALRARPGAQPRLAKLMREFFANVKLLEFGAREAQQAVNVAAFGGGRLSGFDLLLAATALEHRLTLVTERAADFAELPALDVENWMS